MGAKQRSVIVRPPSTSIYLDEYRLYFRWGQMPHTGHVQSTDIERQDGEAHERSEAQQLQRLAEGR